MRPLFLFLVISAACACVGDLAGSKPLGDDGPNGAVQGTCSVDSDCVPAGTTCCACPTFAVNERDAVNVACLDVDCPVSSCSDNVTARCGENNFCELVCAPLACDADCQYGYAMADNGCMTCSCATPRAGGCTTDAECTRTREDCCGCERGGFDTAVLATYRPQYDAMLMCEAEPACPGVNTCTTDEPTCVQGACALVSPDLPVGACGRPDLPACSPGTVCVVNVSDQANMHGVGLCAPAP